MKQTNFKTIDFKFYNDDYKLAFYVGKKESE